MFQQLPCTTLQNVKQIIHGKVNNYISLEFQAISEIPEGTQLALRFLMRESRRAENGKGDIAHGTENRARQRQIFELICTTIPSAADPYAPISPVFSHVRSLRWSSPSGIQNWFAKVDNASLPNVYWYKQFLQQHVYNSAQSRDTSS